MSILKELQDRALIHQYTGLNLEEIVAENHVVYIGMDPTASAIHAGYLIPIALCNILRKHGCEIIVLLGGATAMIGDPTGKSAQRKMLNQEEISANLQSLKSNIAKFFPNSKIVNNNDWLGSMGLMEFLSMYARHVSINALIKLESFSKRLQSEQSLSMLEMFYPILQGYDFYYLNKHYNCTLQLGGSDQWGNILYGVDMVKRLSGETVYGLTCPLLLNHAGEKMGKTVAGAIWLDEQLCSVFDFWQYWRNIADIDAIRFAKIFLNLEYTSENMNDFKKKFATEMTIWVHGHDKAQQAEERAIAMFEQQNFDDILLHKCAASDRLCDILLDLSWVSSLAQAKDIIKSGGVTINHIKVIDPVYIPENNDVMCKGKKMYCRIVKA